MKEIPDKENIWSNFEIFQTQNRNGSYTTSVIIKNYNAKSEFNIAGKGKVFIIELEKAMLGSDIIEKFKGKIVGINDKLWTVKGVELPAVANREFLIVALLVN